MADLEALLDDLTAESADLDHLVASLDGDGWTRPTPAEGWTIAHQIGHLTWTDEVAVRAATDPDSFAEVIREAMRNIATFIDDAAADVAANPGTELLDRWRRARTALAEALREVPAGTKLPWFGPPMSPMSMGTARLMETWAHGQDVADALGVRREPTARIRNIAHIGVRTRDFAFTVHNRPAPAEPFLVELSAPDGSTWSWGPEDAAQRVRGSAVDFCLLVTQRRHREDLDLVATGPDAAEWLTIAQAFAGPAGAGRAAGQFDR
ncbi:MAG: TIGR03084 family protein [Nocardia sp.]|nr:TIGR03084 family protein [Nocardia sp.]